MGEGVAKGGALVWCSGKVETARAAGLVRMHPSSSSKARAFRRGLNKGGMRSAGQARKYLAKETKANRRARAFQQQQGEPQG
jgi:hypothetical protein